MEMALDKVLWGIHSPNPKHLQPRKEDRHADKGLKSSASDRDAKHNIILKEAVPRSILLKIQLCFFSS